MWFYTERSLWTLSQNSLSFKFKIAVLPAVKVGTWNRTRSWYITSELLQLFPLYKLSGGNHYTSAFHGLGKCKAYKLMTSSDEFLELYGQLGNSFTFTLNFSLCLEVCLQTLWLKKWQHQWFALWKNFARERKVQNHSIYHRQEIRCVVTQKERRR